MKYTPSKYKIVYAGRANDDDAQAGEIVYRCAMNTYGLDSDDERTTGIEHIAVTRNADGGYPFFTIPREDLERIKE